MMSRAIILSIALLIGCKQREDSTTHNPASNTLEVDSIDTFQQQETYDYSAFYGSYSHESSTKGFSGYLTLRQSGLDIYFNLSINQPSCIVNMEGIIAMIDHTEHFYVGFHHSEKCQLQFTFMLADKKVDIKEVSGCVTVNRCSTEGTYIKQVPAQ